MKDGAIEKLVAAFEEAARRDDDGVEFWTARDLARLLEYADYRNFLNIIEKAKISCKNSGQQVSDHFVDATDMIELGKGAVREVDEYPPHALCGLSNTILASTALPQIKSWRNGRAISTCACEPTRSRRGPPQWPS